MANTIPLPPGGLEKAQRALDLGATPAEVERLGLGWVRVVDGRAVAADSVPVEQQSQEEAQKPAAVPAVPTPEVVDEVQQAEAVPAEQESPVLPDQPVAVIPEQPAEVQQEKPAQPAVFEDPSVKEFWEQRSGGIPTRPIGHKEEKPGAMVQLGAAIEAFSPTKALFDELSSSVYPPDPSFNFYDHYDEVKQTVHPDFWPTLAESRSKAELDNKMQKIASEQFAVQTIFDGNKVVGGTAVVGAILGDPTTAIGGVAELAAMTKLASASRLANAARGAAIMGATTAAQEGIVAAARETVTADDVVTGALIGAGLGLGFGAALRPARHADLLQETRRISSEVREERGQVFAKDTGDAPGASFTATFDDLPPRRFERVVQTSKEDRVAVTQAIRQRTEELQSEIRRGATAAASKEGLRTAKKALSKAREEAFRIDRLPGRPGRRAAQRAVSAAQKVVDDIAQAQQSSRAASRAAKELKAFRALSREQKIVAVFGEAGAPQITRAAYRETAESAAEREAAVTARQQAEESVVDTHAGKGGSVGAARADTDETPIDLTLQQRDIIDDAETWVANNDEVLREKLNSKTGRVIQRMAKAGVSMDSTFFLSAKSAVGKFFGATILENGAGLGGREKTAAILKDRYEKQLLKTVMPQYVTSYRAWAKAQGINPFNLKKYYGTGKTRFDSLLREELELRRLAGSDTPITSDRAIKDIADAWQKGTDAALDLMKRTGVRGADDIERQPGYVPLKWLGNKIRRLSPSTRDAYRGDLARNYTKTMGISIEDANLIASAVFQRAMKGSLQLDTNPAALLTGDARAELRAMLEETGANPGQLEALFKRIDNRTGDRGKYARLRSRNAVDLTQVTEGRRLMDLVDNEMDVLGSRYFIETAGRSALARKGITSDADWDTLARTVLQDMTAKDPKIEAKEIADRLESIRSQMLGRPVGEGINKNVRRLMDLATLSMLGQVGFAQLAELGTITGQLGMRTMLEEIPNLKRFLREARINEVDPDLIDEIESLTGLVDEHILYRPGVRLEDAAGEDMSWMEKLDKGFAAGHDMLGYASGMNHIKRFEQRLATKALASKVARLAQGKTVGRLTPERLADIGWEDKTLTSIKDHINRHATFDAKGKLQRLNMEQWTDPNVVEDFALGLNRFAHQVVQRPLIGETTGWMHRTLGALFSQFRHFPLVAMEKQLARNVMHQDMATFSTVTYGLAWSGVAYIAKQVANAPGQEDGWLEDRLTAERIAKGAVQYSGMAALIPDGISVLAYAGIVPSEWAFNAGRTGGHKQSSLSLQVVPALGAAEDLFNTATAPTRALWEDYEIGKKDVSALQGATVLGNTLPANIIFGLMKQGAE